MKNKQTKTQSEDHCDLGRKLMSGFYTRNTVPVGHMMPQRNVLLVVFEALK